MNKDLVKEDRLIKDFAEIIRSQLEFSNGWKITEDAYKNHCDIASKRIIRIMKRRKILPNEPKRVRNNEQKGKKCVMVTGEVNCCNKCLDIPYEPNI